MRSLTTVIGTPLASAAAFSAPIAGSSGPLAVTSSGSRPADSASSATAKLRAISLLHATAGGTAGPVGGDQRGTPPRRQRIERDSKTARDLPAPRHGIDRARSVDADDLETVLRGV